MTIEVGRRRLASASRCEPDHAAPVAKRRMSTRVAIVASSAVVLAMVGARPEPARAAGALAATGVIPVEERVAIAVGDERTTTWSSLAVDGNPGTLAVVVPTLDGSSLDTSSRAFFEALEVATAPRVLPPNQVPAGCPGDPSEPTYSIEGDVTGAPPLEPVEVVVLSTSADVASWASLHGLSVDAAFATALDSFGPSYRFVVLRFDAPGGPAITRTIRASAPGIDPTVPLVLSRASTEDLHVTAWTFGAGRAYLSGNEATINTDSLSFKVSDQTSNYRSIADSVLSDPARHAVETAGHKELAQSTSLFDGSASIDSLSAAYYQRAYAYGDATSDPAMCTFNAATLLNQASHIGHACPRADLGSAGSAPACTETVLPSELDPAALRCGGIADDLAVALSDVVASDAWITRSAVRIPVTKSGVSSTVSFTMAAPVDPVLEATSIDQSGCGGSGSTSSTGSSTGSSGIGNPTSGSGGGTMVQVPVYQHEGCDCGGSYALVGYEDVDAASSDVPDAYYDDSSDSCASSDSSSDTSAADSCASDPSTSDSVDSSGCDCSGDSGSADDCSGDSSGTDTACSGDSSGDSCDSGSGDACDFGSADSGSCDCSVPRHGRRNRLHARMSPIAYGLALVLMPFRRWVRRRNEERRRRKRRARRERRA